MTEKDLKQSHDILKTILSISPIGIGFVENRELLMRP